jgi:NADPH-dependent curcumin reductase CurA
MVLAGQLRAPETIHHGLEAVPGAFLAMLAGNGVGKHVVQIED